MFYFKLHYLSLIKNVSFNKRNTKPLTNDTKYYKNTMYWFFKNKPLIIYSFFLQIFFFNLHRFL